MFDFGLSMGELMVIAMVVLIVVGPKDLPRMLRTIGKFITQLRGMAGEFQRHLNSAIREAGIDDVKKEVKSMTNFTVTSDIDKQVTEEFRRQSSEIKTMLDAPEKEPEPQAAAPEAAPAEPAQVTEEFRRQSSEIKTMLDAPEKEPEAQAAPESAPAEPAQPMAGEETKAGA